MKNGFLTCCALALCGVAAPVAAESLVGLSRPEPADEGAAYPYLECVPYARQVSGIQIFGDAHTWWGQAEGRYQRGVKPRVGAVMAFAPHGNMQLGHVAAVSRVIDSRTVLLRHANWSPINGRRGQIENDVRAIDVSEDNDWSAVRVWYAPIQALGGTQWPVSGFIYRDAAKGGAGKGRAGSITLARNEAGKSGSARAGAQYGWGKAGDKTRTYTSARWDAQGQGAFAPRGTVRSGMDRKSAGMSRDAGMPENMRVAGQKPAVAARGKRDPIDTIIARTLK